MRFRVLSKQKWLIQSKALLYGPEYEQSPITPFRLLQSFPEVIRLVC